MKKQYFAVLAIIPLVLIACGKKSDGDAPMPGYAQGASPSNSAPTSGQGSTKRADSDLPKADPSTPDNQYRKITDPSQLLAYSTALSPLPVDYTKIAAAISQEYRQTPDGFKKHDIEIALKPKIDAMLADAKTNRYFRFDVRAQLDSYDFSSKAFGTQISNDTVYSSTNYNQREEVEFSNGDNFKKLVVADEGVARKIEELRSQSQLNNFELQICAFAQEADLNGGRLKAQIVKVRLVDQQGNLVAEQKMN